MTNNALASLLQRRFPALVAGDFQAITQVEVEVSSQSFRGIAIAAPQEHADAAQPLPIVLLSQRSMLRGWQVREEFNVFIACTALRTGKVTLQRAFRATKDTPPPPGQRPPPPASTASPSALETRVQKIEATLPAGARGPIVLAALYFDEASNAVRVNGPVGADSGPAAPQDVSPLPNPGKGLPTFRLDGTPVAGSQPLSFSASADANGTVTLRGQFIRAIAASPSPAGPPSIVDNGVPAAVISVVPLSVVVVGLDGGYQRIDPLRAPVYLRTADGHGFGGMHVELPGEPFSPGAYAVYVFMDGVPYGPQKLQFR